MMAGMVEETLEQKLKRHEDALSACMLEITRLREENARLCLEKSDALSVLKEIYSDPDASQAHRIKAAGLALPHEVPRLTPVPPAIDATCEEIHEPLAVLVERRRARADRLLALPLEERAALIPGCRGNGGDGGGEH
jgi:hypothetical protein